MEMEKEEEKENEKEIEEKGWQALTLLIIHAGVPELGQTGWT